MPAESSYLPPPKPEDDADVAFMLEHTRLLGRACSSMAGCAQALKPPMRVPTVKDPPLVDFVDVVVAPSAHVAGLPSVIAAGLPSLHLRPTVDTTEFHLDLYRRLPEYHSPTARRADSDATAPARPGGTRTRRTGKNRCSAIRGEVDIVIGTAGRLAPEKNMGLLVHAYAMLRKRLQEDSDSQAGSTTMPRTRLLLVRSLPNSSYSASVTELENMLSLFEEFLVLTITMSIMISLQVGKSDSPYYWEGLAFMSDALGVPRDEVR
jgi:glycosyltransferase involved in cell wall biosynthesis